MSIYAYILSKCSKDKHLGRYPKITQFEINLSHIVSEQVSDLSKLGGRQVLSEEECFSAGVSSQVEGWLESP